MGFVGFGGGRGPEGPIGATGPTGTTAQSGSVTGASPSSTASTQVLFGSRRSTDATPFLLMSVSMAATGESVQLEGSIQCCTEGTHTNHAAWHTTASGRRTSAGASARTCPAGGGGAGQTANDFTGGKPAIEISRPDLSTSPNVLHELGYIATGKAGTAILWMYALTVTRIRVT